MTPWSYRRRNRMTPALAAALVLHLGLLLVLIGFSRPATLPMGTSVPINIVANGPTTDSRPAEQAPVAEAAQAATPVPEAKPPEPAPPPPPEPAAKAEPPRPAPPKPAPAIKPTPAKPRKDTFDLAAIQADVGARRQSFSLSALQADVSRDAKAHPSRPAFAARGPTRAETATEARVDAGTGVSQSDIAGLSELLQRLWNPDCSVDERVVIPLRFTVGFDGHIQGRVDAGGRESSSDPVVFAAARRAIDAVHEAAPYAQTYRGLTITVRFDAKKACAERN
jgi:outer membrane biosynthesis protein TonB